VDPEFQLDHKRSERIGIAEAVLCAGKSSTQIEAILEHAGARASACLLTRLHPDAHAALDRRWRERIDYDPVSRTGYLDYQPPSNMRRGVCVVTAGTSDVPVAREAGRVLIFNGIRPAMMFDVGIAGLWRLMDRLEEIAGHRVVIAIAGMEGALPTVLAGLVPGLVIGVPTSTGYGATRGGEAAMMAMLSSCAPGLVVTNIDNGYGAACAAIKVLAPDP
jgi:hypothetical protein